MTKQQSIILFNILLIAQIRYFSMCKASACLSLFFILFITTVNATTHNVSVSSNIFTPNSLTIEAGDTVRWSNTGGGHNVRASDGSFRCAEGCDDRNDGGNGNPSGALWSFEITFHTIGTVSYFCEPHINFGMQGSITVVEPSSVAVHEIHATTANDFLPADLTIQRGDVVRFINDGGVHNINSTDNSLICSEGCFGDGTNADFNPTGFPWDIYVKFNSVEEISYHCSNHQATGNTGILRVLTDTVFSSGFE